MCKRCGKEGDYYPSNKAACKACLYQAQLNWKRSHRNQNRSYKLRARYGIDLDQYERLVVQQDSRCAICLGYASLVVDHDHKTGKIRGLLCRTCNQGLGLFKEDAQALRNAASYMEK